MQAAAKSKAKRQTCSNNKNKAHRAEEQGGEREEDCKETRWKINRLADNTNIHTNIQINVLVCVCELPPDESCSHMHTRSH